jgi:hypothetical protein
MEEQELRSKEDRRKDTERRKVSDRRKSNILNYELLNLDRPDKRSGSDRRSGKERRIESAK